MPPDGDSDEPAQLLHAAHDRELAQLREHIDALAEEHRTQLTEHDDCLATVDPAPDALAEWLVRVCATTRSELRCLVQGGGWRPGAETPHRTVAETSHALADDRAERRLPKLPVTMYLADDQLAVVVRAGDGGVVVVHPSLMLVALGELFEALWTRAGPQAARRAADQQGQLADLLLTGLTDEAIGHQLGVGQRTVQRRIAALLVDLGAVTRFQAGVQAALRADAGLDAEGARPG